MPCSQPNCVVKIDSKRAIVCWLCDNVVHIKCAKLTGKLADLIEDNASGLHWYCTSCRKVNAGICALYREAKCVFKGMSKDLLAMQEKLAAYEKLFLNYNLDAPIAPKKPVLNLKPSCSSLSVPARLITDDDDLIALSPLSCHPPVNDLPNPPSSNTTQQKRKKRSSQSSLDSPSSPKAKRVVENASIENAENVETDKSKKPPNKSPLVKTTLKVVLPMKSVFISRLAAETSEDDLSSYISEKLPGSSTKDFKIKKFNFSYNRFSASFKISLPASSFDSVVQTSFWPSGIIVHEFVKRQTSNPNEPKPIGTKTVKPNSVSKN